MVIVFESEQRSAGPDDRHCSARPRRYTQTPKVPPSVDPTPVLAALQRAKLFQPDEADNAYSIASYSIMGFLQRSQM